MEYISGALDSDDDYSEWDYVYGDEVPGGEIQDLLTSLYRARDRSDIFAVATVGLDAIALETWCDRTGFLPEADECRSIWEYALNLYQDIATTRQQG